MISLSGTFLSGFKVSEISNLQSFHPVSMPLATNAGGRIHGLQEIRRHLPVAVMCEFSENNQTLFCAFLTRPIFLC